MLVFFVMVEKIATTELPVFL